MVVRWVFWLVYVSGVCFRRFDMNIWEYLKFYLCYFFCIVWRGRVYYGYWSFDWVGGWLGRVWGKYVIVGSGIGLDFKLVIVLFCFFGGLGIVK